MRKKLWVGAAVVPMLAVGQWVAPQVGSAAVPSSTQAPLSSAQAAALSANVTKKVIVVLKDQVAQAPASRTKVATRRSIESSEQRPIVSELSQTKARNVKTYTTVNAVAATVSPGEASRLAANPAVAEVVPDQIIRLAPLAPASLSAAGVTTRTPLPGECGGPDNPQLAPQADSVIRAVSDNPHAPTARSLGFDGSGVTVGFIADGLDINNQEFIRPDGSHVFTDFKDFSGEGTSSLPTGGGEAFLDAGSIAAQGSGVYDISHYSAQPLSRPCDIRIEGVAPGVSLVGLDIFGAEDAGYNSSFLQAIDYAVSVDHVNVLNESLGSNPYPDDQASLDLIKAANDAAVAAGTTVTASSGDAGVTGTIGAPSSDPNVLSVGASTTYLGEVQANYGGSQFGVTGYLDDNISSFSSAGFEQDGATVSLVAPGELNWLPCTPTSDYYECTNYLGQPSPVQLTGGTSESAPVAAGVAALVYQAYARTHGGTFPTPAVVKQIITGTADDISAPAELQGTGRIDAYRAVIAAESYQAPAPAGLPSTVLASTTQFNSVAAPGTPEDFAETLTNLGTRAETVALSSRQLGAYRPLVATTVNLSDTASPTSVDFQGHTDNYETVTFRVPQGVDRLNASIAYQGSSSALSSRVRLTLIDPSGRLADYSVPQGIGNYGNTQVANPEGGLWTAYVWSRQTSSGGTTGPVLFGASVANYRPFGTVTPASVRLAPGASTTVHLAVVTPRTPGDTAGSLVAAVAGQPAQTVPVTLRSLVPTGTTSFGGILTGGNGRSAVTGVSNYYQLDLAKGTPELNASVTLANNPDNQTFAWLIDPSGQAQAYQSNGVITSDSSGNLSYTNTLGLNLHVLSPAAGRWTMIVLFAPTVSGTALSEPFTVSVDQNPAQVQASGAPSGNRRVTVNHPAVVRVHVTNTGTAPEAYFVDGRLDATTNYQLAPLSSASTTVPLNFSEPLPVYEVPSQTQALAATASTTGSEPIQFDLGGPSGDPDIASDQGLSVATGLTGHPVSAGVWDIAPTTVGPFGPTGATQEPVTTSLTATTQAFDSGVTSATGDLWQSALGAPITVSSVIVQPGQSATIPVIISPPAGATTGQSVSGVLYLDDDSLYYYAGGLAPNANTVAAVPYSYRVG